MLGQEVGECGGSCMEEAGEAAMLGCAAIVFSGALVITATASVMVTSVMVTVTMVAS